MNLLFVGEQGIGDCLQFARYGKVLHDIYPGSRISMYTYRDDMADLLRLIPGWDHIYSPKDEEIPKDYYQQIALLSIPLLLTYHGWDDFIIPPIAPDIKAHDGYYKRQGLNIGICWKGNPAHPNDEWRSIGYARMLPLIGNLSINNNLYSFQWEDTESDLEKPDLSTWMKTAEALQAMDLLITVDTAIAHLAGTLFIPTWIMLAAHMDWRWGETGSSTRWYPTARLFRQEQLDEWGKVLDQVSREAESSVTS